MSGTISGRCPGCPVRNQAMKENLQKNTYSKLVKDITELYRAKSPENATVSPNSQNIAAGGTVELAYNRIHQAPGELRDTEQQGDDKAEYGVGLLEHLLEDLQHKLGSGFSKRDLLKNATILPGSPNIAGAGNIELADHRISW